MTTRGGQELFRVGESLERLVGAEGSRAACCRGVFQELCRHEVEAYGGSAWEVWGSSRLSLAGRELGNKGCG